MPSLSFASWNVEHFEGDDARVADRVEFLRESDPDVFALYESGAGFNTLERGCGRG
jgi:hypothetical protein